MQVFEYSKPDFDPYGDNEGLLSHIPAVATCLLGVLTGWWLMQPRPALQKLRGIAVAGPLRHL